MSTDFHIYSLAHYMDKLLTIRQLLNISPHHICVAALPCKI